MRYDKRESKQYAQQHLRGIWAAVPTTFKENLDLDLEAFGHNVEHWVEKLQIDGLFVGGKQGEFFSMSIEERKRLFETSVRCIRGASRPAGVMLSCSDQNPDVVLKLAQHAEVLSADYIVVHSPMLPFATDVDSTVYEYYRYLSECISVPIAMWNHPDCGYVMSPALCARIARDCPSIVAIKYSVARSLYAELTHMTQGTLLVSSSSEVEWLDNIAELGWRLYLCSIPPILYQTPHDRRMQQYTQLAFSGDLQAARLVRDSLEPVRRALHDSRPPGTPHAQQKYWQELLGQAGGPVRPPLLNLTDSQRKTIQTAFAQSGLRHM